jgi:hypothetical protein
MPRGKIPFDHVKAMSHPYVFVSALKHIFGRRIVNAATSSVPSTSVRNLREFSAFKRPRWTRSCLALTAPWAAADPVSGRYSAN